MHRQFSSWDVNVVLQQPTAAVVAVLLMACMQANWVHGAAGGLSTSS